MIRRLRRARTARSPNRSLTVTPGVRAIQPARSTRAMIRGDLRIPRRNPKARRTTARKPGSRAPATTSFGLRRQAFGKFRWGISVGERKRHGCSAPAGTSSQGPCCEERPHATEDVEDTPQNTSRSVAPSIAAVAVLAGAPCWPSIRLRQLPHDLAPRSAEVRLGRGSSVLFIPINLVQDLINIPYNEVQAINLLGDNLLFQNSASSPSGTIRRRDRHLGHRSR